MRADIAQQQQGGGGVEHADRKPAAPALGQATPEQHGQGQPGQQGEQGLVVPDPALHQPLLAEPPAGQQGRAQHGERGSDQAEGQALEREQGQRDVARMAPAHRGFGALRQPAMQHGGGQQAIGNQTQRAMQRQPARARGQMGRAREQQRQQHGRRAQPDQRGARAQLRVEPGFDRVEREDQPGRERQRRCKAEPHHPAVELVGGQRQTVQQPDHCHQRVELAGRQPGRVQRQQGITQCRAQRRDGAPPGARG